MTPQYSGGPAPPAAPVAAPAPIAAPVAPAAAAPMPDMAAFARVPDITRKLNHQTSAEAVLNLAATEIGTQWGLERCVAVLRKPGLTISAVKEFVAGVKPAQADVLEDVVCRLHDMAAERGPIAVADVASARDIAELAPQLAQIGARSLLALSLSDGNDSFGALVLISSSPRNWGPNDVLVFKMIAEQAAIALSNAGLRRLVKNLSVTDENSGLLKRASYLDLLSGEIRRARQQSTPATVLLMRFGDRALIKEQGEAVAKTMQRLGQVVAANIRQNDLAFRYTANSIAIVLGETAEKEALMAAEKMRRVISAAIAEQQVASYFNVGIAEAVLRNEYDVVDIVTELINRAERALEKSVAEGPGKSLALSANLAAAAVA